MRSKSEQRKQKHRYASARDRADKKKAEGSFSATYIQIPQGAKFFKPKAGLMLLDIIPFPAGKGNPCAEPGALWYERTFHLHPRIGVDSNAFLCLRLSSGKPCPICEFRSKLLRKGSDTSEEQVKDMAPKERQLFNVINRKEPEKGIQIWDVSYHLFGKLLDARIRNSDEDEGYDRFHYLEGGMTLKVGFKEKSYEGRTFLETETIDFKPRAEDLDEDLLEKAYCLDDLLVHPDYDDLKAIFLETSQDDEDGDDDEDKPRKSKSTEPDDDDDDDDEEEDDGEEEERPKKKHREEPEDEEEEDDEEEDEPPKKKKSKASDDDEEEEEPEDEDDEEEEEPRSKKSKSKDDDDDDDGDDSQEDAEEEEDDDEEEDEPPKKKKSKSKEPDDDDEDWSEFEVDNSDEDTDADGKPRVHAHKLTKKHKKG